jgi:hypothetical protein
VTEFSLVCPVYKEIDLIPRSLPSFYKVNPSEVILCFDDPVPSKETYELCQKISRHYNQIPTEFVLVKRNPEYKLHQAWVRRTGFRKAKYDRILTVDTDLVINKKVLKAVELVGKDNIGLVSCSKEYPHKGIQRMWLMITQKIVNLVYPVQFTGLYALWKPYWLDSEEEGVKRLEDMKQTLASSDIQTGEDTYLRNCIVKKHKVIYLKNVGATCLTFNSSDLPHVQWQDGRYFASQGYNLFRILLKVILYFRIYTLLGWMYEKGYHR